MKVVAEFRIFNANLLFNCVSPDRAASCHSGVALFVTTMKDYAKAFYKSAAWKNCRATYAAYRHGLCEICLARGIYKPGEIVHHKVHLTPENINDPTVTLSWDHLQLVCRDCHAELHGDRKPTRWMVDEAGRVRAV